MAAARMPLPSSCCARRLAPCLVRVNTSTCCQLPLFDQVREQVPLVILRHAIDVLLDALGGGVARRDLDGHRLRSMRAASARMSSE